MKFFVTRLTAGVDVGTLSPPGTRNRYGFRSQLLWDRGGCGPLVSGLAELNREERHMVEHNNEKQW
jgi:hypothetical protein